MFQLSVKSDSLQIHASEKFDLQHKLLIKPK